jgi:hypothetical protein
VRLFAVKASAKNPDTLLEAEFPFSGFQQFGSVAWGDKGLKAQLAQGKGGIQAGVKSFSYHLAGTNPAEAEAIIKAKIVFWFASMNDLFANRKVKYKGNKIIEKGSLSFSKLINYGAQAKHLRYDASRFTIKAVVGWAQPQINPKDRNLLQGIEESIKYAQTALILQLIAHDLKLNQDGSINLEVDYIARIEASMSNSSLNVFWIPQSERLKAIRDKYAKAQQKRYGLAQEKAALTKYVNELRTKKAGDPLSPESRAFEKTEAYADSRQRYLDSVGARPGVGVYSTTESRTDYTLGTRTGAKDPSKDKTYWVSHAEMNRNLKEDYLSGAGQKRHQDTIAKQDKLLEEVEKEKDRLVAGTRIGVYRRILRQLDLRGRTFTFKVDKSELGIFSSTKVGSTGKAIASRVGGQGKLDVTENKTAAAAKVKADKDKSGEGSKTSNIKLVSEDIDELKADVVSMPFFYLGDLINILLQIMKLDIEGVRNKRAAKVLKKLTILVGPVTIVDAKGSKYSINISNIPISHDLFLAWFQDNVIRRDRTHYNLFKMISDILSSLVLGALGQGCFRGVKQPNVAGLLSVQSIKAEGGTDRIPQYGARCSVRSLKAAAALHGEFSKTISEIQEILYIFAREQNPSYLTGELKFNKDHGIHNIQIGANRGLIKNVSFSKTDFPYQLESRIVAHAEDSKYDGFLREKYDATITMVGNTLFKPGQYFYMDPRFPNSDPADVKKLGFGGYFFVHEVNHVIQVGHYEAEVKGVWQAFGKKLAGGGAKVRNWPPAAYNSPPCKVRNLKFPVIARKAPPKPKEAEKDPPTTARPGGSGNFGPPGGSYGAAERLKAQEAVKAERDAEKIREEKIRKGQK